MNLVKLRQTVVLIPVSYAYEIEVHVGEYFPV